MKCRCIEQAKMETINKCAIQDIILSNLNDQRKYGRFCDIRLTVGNKFTWTHSAVMCSISPLIDKQCCNALKCPKMKNSKTFSFSTPLTIKLSEDNSFDCFNCLQYLVDFIYGQKIEQTLIHNTHFSYLFKLLDLSEILINIINNQLFRISGVAEVCKTKCIGSESVTLNINSTDDSKISLQKSEKLPTKVMIHRKKTWNMNSSTASGKMQTCIECKYKCYKPRDLLAHLRNTGHGEDVCSLCFVHLPSFQELNNHYNMHDHPKPFFCTFCDVRFQTRTLLNQHLPRHSTETPYTCPHCKKGFKWKYGLNSHMMIHSNEKKHLCDECGFSTTHAKTLRAHKLTHTGDLFRCTHPGCTHTSSRKENMKIHVGTHNNDKPFVCEICGHKFTQSKSLKRHALKHSNTGLINLCPHCPFKALRSDNLKSHILRHHTEKPLNLELSENFTEPLINTDCELIKLESDLELDPDIKNGSDLSVLADAASSRMKILDPSCTAIKQELIDGNPISRNFDNLIANPIVSSDENDSVVNIDQIQMFVLCDVNGESDTFSLVDKG